VKHGASRDSSNCSAFLAAGGRVGAGKASDLPVYFGDAGSPAVLHSVGAERAACAVITLDTPGANYRSVWAMQKHFPAIKTYVRAHDINHGINLEKAGATVVVPETLEPSMQLAASVLSQFKLPPEVGLPALLIDGAPCSAHVMGLLMCSRWSRGSRASLPQLHVTLASVTMFISVLVWCAARICLGVPQCSPCLASSLLFSVPASLY
jgi:hypothetical protein